MTKVARADCKAAQISLCALLASAEVATFADSQQVPNEPPSLHSALPPGATASEPLDAVRRRSFDLNFMDVRMPVLDGLATTRSIRLSELPLGRHIPIVALTAGALPD